MSLLNFGQYVRRSGSYLNIVLSSGILDIFGVGTETFSTRSPSLD